MIEYGEYSFAYLISIHPRFADLIYEGKKTIELRRKFNPKFEHEIVYFYETAPVKKITGWAYVEIGDYVTVGSITPELLDEMCISEDEFINYIGDSQGRMLHLGGAQRFPIPMDLSDAWNRRPPQSWKYFYYSRFVDVDELLTVHF